MFDTAMAGSLPKPAWLAETGKLWPQWKLAGAELAQAKLDATLRWIKAQEDAGLDGYGIAANATDTIESPEEVADTIGRARALSAGAALVRQRCGAA
jgi:methionine synthase II (cobalamin-independent)